MIEGLLQNQEWLVIAVLTLLAGLAMPIGAAIASIEKIHPAWLETEVRHSIIAFGGGTLLSAVALVLIPEGIKLISLGSVIVCFAGGGLCFMVLDILIARSNSSASQLVAMLTDFLPEAIALGATFVENAKSGVLLALIMILQNTPEGFNAFREIKASGNMSTKKVLSVFFLLALLGPVAGLSGYFFLSSSMPLVGGLMVFAAGGILYLTIQDIAPQAVLKRHWAPSMGAVAGFLLGVIGHILIG